jgi:REP element-mobilizing transposase RayT
MPEPAYKLDAPARAIVLEAIREVCNYRHWTILAAHVRSTHAHCVVDAEAQPNRVIADFKAYSSRALNRTEGPRQRWAREGSTQRLPDRHAVQAAVRYVLVGQGEPMAVFASIGGCASPG